MTTNNHPAHGPVSLDRLHQIREILSKAAAQSDGGNLGYAMADAVKVIDGAIAAHNEEPVAYMTYKGYLLHAGDPKVSEYSEPTPLYTAPVVPVVPDELLSVMEEVLRISDRDHEAWHKARNGIASCRDAMLQGADGNSPVIPDGWQLVPKKITLEMECAISRADSYEIGWKWALAAAPKYEVK
ncbi:hypothetical protein ACSP9K_000577 [Citrobacter werkmanii]